MSISSGKYCFYYMARENLCFLTLCEESYPKRMAFLYLEEVADVILQELIREHGNDVRENSISGVSMATKMLHFRLLTLFSRIHLMIRTLSLYILHPFMISLR